MFSFKSLSRRIKKNRPLSLLVASFLPLLLLLGNWQLSRAEEKRQLQTVYQQQRNMPAIPLYRLDENREEKEDNLYRSVTVRGTYDRDRYWLLDNRSRGGQPGYEVIMPLVNDRLSILVNRGWLAAGDRRDQLTPVPTPETMVSLQGYLYSGDANALIKHSISDWPTEWPKRVLHLDAREAEQALGTRQYPMMLRINDNSPGAFLAHWHIVNSSPVKHQAYALQWFAMALALLILYGWALTRTPT